MASVSTDFGVSLHADCITAASPPKLHNLQSHPSRVGRKMTTAHEIENVDT